MQQRPMGTQAIQLNCMKQNCMGTVHIKLYGDTNCIGTLHICFNHLSGTQAICFSVICKHDAFRTLGFRRSAAKTHGDTSNRFQCHMQARRRHDICISSKCRNSYAVRKLFSASTIYFFVFFSSVFYLSFCLPCRSAPLARSGQPHQHRSEQ